MFKKGLLTVFVLSFFVTSSFSQTKDVSVETHENLDKSSQVINEKEDALISDNGEVSLDFQEADIKNVLRILAFKSGVNIIASPQVVGTVTIQLKNVPWKDALDVILQTYGYAYEQKGNIIIVTTVEDLKKIREDTLLLSEQEPLETKTFTLNFAKASKIIESISKMKSERGSIDFDSRTNMLIVTDSAGKIELISKVIKKLDKTSPQVLIESKIVETVLEDDENLGIEWTTGFSATVTPASITHTFPFTPPIIDNKYITSTITSSDSIVSNGTLSLPAFNATLELLKSRVDTNVMSNPSIVALDNEEAIIKVTRTIRVSTGSTTDSAGNVTTDTKEIDVGITLRVTPYVNNANFVTLDVKPEVSAAVNILVDGLPQTVKDSKEAETTVMVKNKETLVIGGLIKSEEIETKKRVPFLGDIPILGFIFRKTEKAIEKRDLLIFITPTIITPEIFSGS